MFHTFGIKVEESDGFQVMVSSHLHVRAPPAPWPAPRLVPKYLSCFPVAAWGSQTLGLGAQMTLRSGDPKSNMPPVLRFNRPVCNSMSTMRYTSRPLPTGAWFPRRSLHPDERAISVHSRRSHPLPTQRRCPRGHGRYPTRIGASFQVCFVEGQ